MKSLGIYAPLSSTKPLPNLAFTPVGPETPAAFELRMRQEHMSTSTVPLKTLWPNTVTRSAVP